MTTLATMLKGEVECEQIEEQRLFEQEEYVVAVPGGLALGAATVRRLVPTVCSEDMVFMTPLVSRSMATPRDSSQHGYAKRPGGSSTRKHAMQALGNFIFMVNRAEPQ